MKTYFFFSHYSSKNTSVTIWTYRPTSVVMKLCLCCHILTLTRRSCLLPLYHVMTAGGLEPADSQDTSYRRSATRGSCLVSIRTVRGRTVSTDTRDIEHKHKHKQNDKNTMFIGEYSVLVHTRTSFVPDTQLLHCIQDGHSAATN